MSLPIYLKVTLPLAQGTYFLYLPKGDVCNSNRSPFCSNLYLHISIYIVDRLSKTREEEEENEQH